MTYSYAVQRAIDDFITGMAGNQRGFWVRVTAEPTIDDKHRTVVQVELGHGELNMITTLGKYTMKCYPSVLADVDDYLSEGWDPETWLHVECEAEYKSGRYTRRYRIRERRHRTLTALDQQTGPSKPGAGGLPTTEAEAAAVEWEYKPPAAPCPHERIKFRYGPEDETKGDWSEGFYCTDCGERVG